MSDKDKVGGDFLTTPDLPDGTPPMPTSEGSLYLVGLLSKQNGLNVARDALIARAGEAGASETAYIKIQLGQIQSDYLKLSAWINAYVAKSTRYKTITPDGLAAIRKIIEQLQAVVAKKETAQDIIKLVTKLLNEWDGKPAAPTAVLGGAGTPAAKPCA
ncbi:hypothetical protein LSO07_04605 [Janthinobacterium sp. PLB04]|uniref:Uncharacterized protein n=1 Tax=Janthinobacterium lividum TaxID=29581 RepID=A0AAJ4MU78_9BURK|nr:MULTISPECIES: hypothetical protein [Janthinobacterium]KAB0331044.1 hypothetical protein F3B38_04675 [Janthinobacterium lividum]QSX97240.1 hypothetical protein J3P46_04605 [Janthinobacterium lividum]UGQ37164.1 hypothetical protein LSO07_04605 [Janthinobacterium sp. PLB04]